MKPTTILLVGLMLAMTGGGAYCAVDVAAAIAAYKAAPVCCGALAAVPFQSLEAGSKAIALDEKSPAFAFAESGKSYFAAFALPGGTALQVRAKSPIFQNSSRGMAIFFPRILLLDQSKAPLATVTWADDKILHAAEAGGQDYIETVADLSAYPAARFMIVYTDGERIGAEEKLQSVVPEDSVKTPVNGVGYHVFFVEIPDPHTDPFLTTPVIRSPVAPGPLVIDIRNR